MKKKNAIALQSSKKRDPNDGLIAILVFLFKHKVIKIPQQKTTFLTLNFVIETILFIG